MFFRNVDEEENQKKVRQDYAVRCGVLGIAGFILSVIFILLSLVVLVRFWVFDNIAYNIFVLSMLIIGIIFNITSINLTFSEVTVSILNIILKTTWTNCFIFVFRKASSLFHFCMVDLLQYSGTLLHYFCHC